jgi:CheY-like chemotaxis protein
MSKRILVIDDDDLIRSLTTHFLKQGDYDVITAPNGPEGVKQYETEQPDLIVLDIAMPDMSGFEVAKSIRELEKRDQRPHTPIIILTAYARSFFLSVGSESGIDSYLTKPITPEQLLSHVERFLGKPASPASENS